jgi:hypothetical protein
VKVLENVEVSPVIRAMMMIEGFDNRRPRELAAKNITSPAMSYIEQAALKPLD